MNKEIQHRSSKRVNSNQKEKTITNNVSSINKNAQLLYSYVVRIPHQQITESDTLYYPEQPRK